MSVICKEATCEHCGKKSCDCHSFYDTLGIEPADIDFKEQARKERIKRCGQLISHWRPEQKKMIWYKSQCKERDCPDCQKLRVDEMLIRLGGLVGMARVLRLPDDQSARETIESLGLEKEKYLRIPEGDNPITLVLDTEQEVGQILTDKLAQQIAPLVNTPKGRKISGSLGKFQPIPKKEKTNIPQDEIKVREFHINFIDSNLTYKDIQDYVLERTRLMNPHTKYELQTCMNKIEEVTEVAVGELLGDCAKIQKIIRVSMDEIDWRKLPGGAEPAPF